MFYDTKYTINLKHGELMRTKFLFGMTASLALFVFSVQIASAIEAGKITFKKVQIDAKFRSEGVTAGDFNKDGKLDVAAGRVFYTAPDWKMHSMEKEAREFPPKGYSGSFCNFAADVNSDGWTDVILVDFPGAPTFWYENPKKTGALWKQHVCTPVSNNESPTYLDLDGNGRRELIMAVAPSTKMADGPDRQMAFLKPDSDPYKVWHITAFSKKAAPSTTKYSHGLGVGDINKDGRNDILVPQGWWEAPENRTAGQWKFHAAPLGKDAAQMHVYDFDGDGDNDVLSSSAHRFGIWWHEQLGEGKWKTHEIDRSFSQTHGLCLADINSDGLPDFVTGKRWWAHGGRDPGGDQPAVFFWFEMKREGGKVSWVPHQFDHNSGPGTQFEVIDVNGDKLLDVVTSNKKGVHYFQQVRN